MLVVVVLPYWGFFISGLLFYATSTSPWLLRSAKASASSDLCLGYFQLLILPGFCGASFAPFYNEQCSF